MEARLTARLLPTIVSEGLVGLGHLVHVFTSLDGSTEPVAGIEDLIREAQGHRLFPTLAAVADEPADGDGGGAAPTNLHRHLVGGAIAAAALHLADRLHRLARSVAH